MNINPPCFIDDMDEKSYHADPCPTPSLSASIATKIVRDSPWHGWAAHPKLGNYREPPSKEMEVGTLIHAMLLGQNTRVAVIDAKHFRTKAAQEQRDEAREGGAIPILVHDYADLEVTVDAIKTELVAKGVLLDGMDGKSERVAAWEEVTATGPILCRGMMDYTDLDSSQPVIYDLKSCHSAHPETIRKHIVTYGYDLQRAAYLSAVSKIHPELAGRVEYRWVFMELLEPEAPKRVIVTVAEASGTMRELGERRWQMACNKWSFCLKNNYWPGYVDGVLQVEAKPWDLEQYL
jgi:hypothetical protein